MSTRPDDADDARAEATPDVTPDASSPAPGAAAAVGSDEAAAQMDLVQADAVQDEPERADAEHVAPAPPTVERDDVQVSARLVPRYGRFMVLGAIVGAVGGWAFSRLGSSGPWLGAGPTIDTSAVVPFLVVVGVVVGIVLGAVVAIVLDRIVGRRRRTITAERTRHHRDDADA